ncbi:MAG TPA: SDR family oxidoreductase [Sandaracinaceae bacterium LLY-WYZ-13_1]|nr:SDR family oxidoreductase [Sandaracinaceae bacterium LLY-WYZ-13_1]
MRLDEKVFVVTGASSGIGTETARALAARGATVAIVGRSPARTEATERSLREGTGNERVHAFRADFASLEEVHRLADALLSRFDRLDGLINNAGLWLRERRLSEDGHEMTLAVNHLAPFVLTHRLLPRLLESPGEARVVHVSSRLHEIAGRPRRLGWQLRHAGEVLGVLKRPRDARLDLSDPTLAIRYHGLDAYARSKLVQILFSNELARRLAGTRVTSNAVHPGDVATDVVRDSRFLSWGIRVVAPILKTPEEGAVTSVRVATDPALAGVTGRYFADEREATPADVVHDRAAAREVWERSLAWTGLREDELAEAVRDGSESL